MFPVSDVIPSRTTPYVTMALIGLNAAAFLYELQLSQPELEALVRSRGVVPRDFAWSALLTSPFLHDGWVHVLGNLLYLWIFGDNVEDRLGHVRFAVFYVACGAAAALGHVALSPTSPIPLIGASGAIAGVMGAYFVLYPRSQVLTAIVLVVYLDVVEIPAIFFLGVWFLMQLFSGVGSLGATAADLGTAFWAHVAGFLAGSAGGLIARRWRYWPASGPSGSHGSQGS